MTIPKHSYNGKFIFIEGPDNRRFKTQLLGSKPLPIHICLAYNLAFPDAIIEIPENNYKGSIPGVAYSAGIDSACAVKSLDTCTALFLNDGSSFSSFAIESIKSIRSSTVKAFTVDCNVQSLRNPYGFPVDWAVAIPLVINANHLKIDSIATGTILESAYSIGRKSYRNFALHRCWQLWSTIFAQAGLPLNLTVAGLSEVATFDIAITLKLKAKSCIRNVNGYCGKCYKCYRRNAIVGNKLPSSKSITNGIINAHHLNILNYAFNKYGVKFHQNAKLGDFTFLERWYPNSLDLIVPKYREEVKRNILSFTTIMTQDDISKLENYQL